MHVKILVTLTAILWLVCSSACSDKKATDDTTPATPENRLQTPAPVKPAKSEREGKFFGAKMTEYPKWFKESFLDIQEDIKEATQAGRRLIVLWQQPGCPYCNALVERNITQKHIADKLKKHFDIIALNMWGDREITYVDGKSYTEKTLAETLKVQFTPTVLFFNESNQVILRLNGYRSPNRFFADISYVADKKENDIRYRDYIKTNYKPAPSSKKMHPEPFFSPPPFNLKRENGKPLAVFFEQKDCPNCDTLHKQILPDASIRKILQSYDAVQLDMWSAKVAVITPTGQHTTARDWAKALDIKFAPSIVIFNEKGEEIIRSEAFFKVFHTAGIMSYVLEGAYRKQPSFQRYLSDKADRLREHGEDVDIWRMSDEEKTEH